jgi:hypothetical protein
MAQVMYGLMVKFNWTPAELRELEIPTLMLLYWGFEIEEKEMKKQQAKMKTGKHSKIPMRRKR